MARLSGAWKRLDGWQRRVVISVVVGFVTSTAIFLWVFISHGGLDPSRVTGVEPPGVCEVVSIRSAPSQSNTDTGVGTEYYCRTDWLMVAFYIGIPWVPISVIFWFAFTILLFVVNLFVRWKSHRDPLI